MILPNRTFASAIATLILVAAPHFLQSRTIDSTDAGVSGNVVLFVGHLNSDCIADTLFGAMDKYSHYRPVCIRWGRGACRGDTTHPPLPTDPAIVPATSFRYPGWAELSGSVSIERLNQDTLNDIVLYVWGKITDSSSHIGPIKLNGGAQTLASGALQPTAKSRDTMKIVAIFGQSGLDTMRQIDVGRIAGLQSAPFPAMQLRIGTELISPKIRDLSGITSYILPRIPNGMKLDSGMKRDSVMPPQTGIGMSPSPVLHVYPNPAETTTNVESRELPAGRYIVEILAENGARVLRREVLVDEREGLIERLDTRRLGNGYYVVRVYSRQRFIAAYPIIIAR